ncbi:MAG: ABC transporter ATP-binding protein, partial [Stenotrophobium sp.]
PIQIREIRSLITELGQTHSVILSSHILPEIQAVCSRVMIVNRGRAVYDEPVAATRDAKLESLTVELRRAPAASALRNLTGVSGVDELGGGRFVLQLAEGGDPREALSEAAAKNNWGLIELSPGIRTLEEIFIDLTSGEEPQRKAA